MKRSSHAIAVDIGNSGLKMCCFDRPAEAGSNSPGGRLPELRDQVHRMNWEVPLPSHVSAPVACGEGKWQTESIEPLKSAMRTFIDRCMRAWEFDEPATVPWWISSVQQRGRTALLEVLGEGLPVSEQPISNIHIVEHAQVPMPVMVEEPIRLGIDRLLAAYGAWTHQRWGSPILVIQAGTAITVDLVSNRGEFCGGAILPGVKISLRFLAAGTDQLPWIHIPRDDQAIVVPGQNTEQAMLAGVFAAARGGVAHLVQLYRQQFGEATPVIVSGGDGPFIANTVPSPVIVIDQLVLRALGAIASREAIANHASAPRSLS